MEMLPVVFVLLVIYICVLKVIDQLGEVITELKKLNNSK